MSGVVRGEVLCKYRTVHFWALLDKGIILMRQVGDLERYIVCGVLLYSTSQLDYCDMR